MGFRPLVRAMKTLGGVQRPRFEKWPSWDINNSAKLNYLFIQHQNSLDYMYTKAQFSIYKIGRDVRGATKAS